MTKAKPRFPPLEETWAWKSRQKRIAAEEKTRALYWSTPIWMNLTREQIKRLVNNPEIARKPEELRLIRILAGQGHACTPDEKEAEAWALDRIAENESICNWDPHDDPHPHLWEDLYYVRRGEIFIHPFENKYAQALWKYDKFCDEEEDPFDQ